MTAMEKQLPSYQLLLKSPLQFQGTSNQVPTRMRSFAKASSCPNNNDVFVGKVGWLGLPFSIENTAMIKERVL